MNSFERPIILKKSDGTAVVLPYDDISKECIDIRDKFYEVTFKGRKGLINRDGEEILPTEYDEVEFIFFEIPHLCRIKKGKCYGLFDTMLEKIVVESTYDDIEEFDERMPEYIHLGFNKKKDSPQESMSYRYVKTKKDGLYGFYNERDKIEVEPAYDEIGYFHYDIAPVKRGKKWGLINGKGLLVKRIKAKRLAFHEGYFYLAYYEDYQEVWDKDGNVLYTPYDHITVKSGRVFTEVSHSEGSAYTEVELELYCEDGKIKINPLVGDTVAKIVINKTKKMNNEIEKAIEKIANK